MTDAGSAMRRVLASAGELSFDPGQPRHEQIERWLDSLITSGALSVGDRLPSERDLAAELEVSRMTLRQAIAAIERRGLVSRVLGRNGGTIVSQPRIDVDLTGLPGFSHQIRAADQRAGSTTLTAEVQASTRRVADGLGIEVSDPVFHVERVRAANDVPLAIERSYFPAALFPGFLDRDLDGSLYAVLTAYGHQPHTAQEYLQPVVADAENAALLAIEVGTPLMRIERTALSASGVVVELSFDHFRSDLVRIGVRSHIEGDSHAVRFTSIAPPAP